ncbi:MAG: galactose-1-phosphate uridylyltransferase [Chloroflexi bacterium]|nr:galactose-1-phosphate uridylyltransferase [Chloroflexota bacterium]MBI3733358.1 galactose-1-phosphate uridylyltransferase [Chloroflexota bacterium]
MSELRWNPLLGEWVITATGRQDRTYLPSATDCPLCPSRDPSMPTEIPRADFEIVVFENRFPALRRELPTLTPNPSPFKGEGRVRAAQGVCEVVVYTPQHEGTLTDQPVSQIYKLIRVWTDRYAALGALPFVKYVFIFENKGDVVGTTLHHPHGQIYAFPYVPPIPARELAAARAHRAETGRCLLCDIVASERGDGRRVIAADEHFAAYVPFFARFPYEVHIAATAHRESLTEFTDVERWALAQMLKEVLMRYDALFGISLPYMMVLHQAPVGGDPDAHFHIEFYPLNRTREKLKYRAGCESGAGTFVTDALPEEWAAQLAASSVRRV